MYQLVTNSSRKISIQNPCLALYMTVILFYRSSDHTVTYNSGCSFICISPELKHSLLEAKGNITGLRKLINSQGSKTQKVTRPMEAIARSMTSSKQFLGERTLFIGNSRDAAFVSHHPCCSGLMVPTFESFMPLYVQ